MHPDGKGKKMEEKTLVDYDRESYDFALEIVKVLYNHKATNIKVFHVEHTTVLTDYYVICSGRSTTQIKSLADQVDFEMGQHGLESLHTEGRDSGAWVLVDFGRVILHVMGRETREFYNLERLWDDKNEVDITDFLSSLEPQT